MSSEDVQTSAGSTLLVCPNRPTEYTPAGYKALQWTEVAEITDLGEFGREYSKVTHNAVSTRRTIKRKGSFDEGAITLPMARSKNDAGQKLMAAASGSDDSFSYSIRLQDGTCHYFTAQCMSFKTNVGSVDSITGKTAVLEIDSDILEVEPQTFQLKYLAGVNGSILGVPTQTVAEGGSGTPVTAKAAAGFAFEKWSDDSTDNPRVDTQVTAAVTVTASFVAVP
ncbi:hypothetical protein GL58_02880 [Comamonas testosteroni]|uniref:Bacterial repeat domain-containing protein n=1 Tax=Comamonas testosteroni TaxID=285 RepID=A0A0L7MQ51_COMTE|nr:phage tail tube protein [Comamonas testosteroni]KOC23930.1 hypothetical protein GL58_02880 [Comamonas testosteroni]KWT67792.1 hypothetical protein APV28_3597 [Comamonas testosteroni]